MKKGATQGTLFMHEYSCLWEQGLPAMNDNAVQLLHRGAVIAGKPCSHRSTSQLSDPDWISACHDASCQPSCGATSSGASC
ncbi:hypothetical protein DZG01_00445 [Pseudomonas fluorescens]|nr:hypothetical protein DZG01_00445 [Pseudomonas fluorescens]